MEGSFAMLPVSREGRSLVEWLDENIRELDQLSNNRAKQVALGRTPSELYICVEQLRLAVVAIRAGV